MTSSFYRTNLCLTTCLYLTGSLLLSACASLREHPDAPINSVARQQERRFVERLQLIGRILVRYQQNGKEQSVSGSYEWQQANDSIKITLLSPLGQTIATITQDANGATLQQAGQSARQAPDIDSLLQANLGWSLPVQGLRDWLQGYQRDAQGKAQVVAAQDGNIINANGWQIQYVSWQHASPILPKRIDLHRDPASLGANAPLTQLSLRILIDQWEIQ